MLVLLMATSRVKTEVKTKVLTRTIRRPNLNSSVIMDLDRQFKTFDIKKSSFNTKY